MGYTDDLLVGLAQLLAEDPAIGVWKPDEPYADDEVGIVLGRLPQSPDAGIALAAYSVTDDPVHADTTTGVQIRLRTASEGSGPTDDLADLIYDRLHGRWAFELNGIRVQWARRTSGAPLGVDQNQRRERSDNYYFDTWRPAPHRL